MHERFRSFTENLHPKFEVLMEHLPVTTGILRPGVSGSGIYMFSEAGESLYVSRTRDVRERYHQHTRYSGNHNNAPFVFKLARMMPPHRSGCWLASYFLPRARFCSHCRWWGNHVFRHGLACFSRLDAGQVWRHHYLGLHRLAACGDGFLHMARLRRRKRSPRHNASSPDLNIIVGIGSIITGYIEAMRR